MSLFNTKRLVLFAHQSTIPHYRIPFYQTLELQRPESWRFQVAFDFKELQNPQFFFEPLNSEDLHFPLLSVHTYAFKIGGKKISYQTFLRRAADYDLLIVENALNNLAYPLCQIYQLFGTKYAYWGHGRDHGIDQLTLPKKASERLKLMLARKADGFFAYTPRVKEYLEQEGVLPSRIFVVNNTIDINKQRCLFEQWRPHRPSIRQQFGLQEEKTLLFVGRFTPNKRIDLLLEALSLLQNWDSKYHLILVGSGGEPHKLKDMPNVSYLGPIVNADQLAKIYVASDLFAYPGSVGLGPLQALCYDLPIVTIDSNVQMPEFDYLNPDNSIIMPASTSPEAFARTISDLFEDRQKLRALKSGIWPSIQHLTIEQMASNFIQGINAILDS